MNTHQRRWLPAGAILLLLLTAQPASAQWALTCTRDPRSAVNIRRTPTTKGAVIASAPDGTEVRLLGWVYGADGMRWWRVETGGLVGWSRGDFLCR